MTHMRVAFLGRQGDNWEVRAAVLMLFLQNRLCFTLISPLRADIKYSIIARQELR